MLMPVPTPPPVAWRPPWRLPPQGLAVFHGEGNAPRLSHYFLPRLALEGKRILFLDGANCVDPRLMARLAGQRGMSFAQFNQQIMLARAFTCFQLTELIRRVPQFLAEFPAQVLMVTAFPELYFDEDIRQADAHAAFRQALAYLRRWGLGAGDWGLGTGGRGKTEIRNSKIETRDREAELRFSIFEFRPSVENRQSTIGNDQPPVPSPQYPAPSTQPLSVALFSAASGFQPPPGRKLFFSQTCAAATELWKFQVDGEGQLRLAQQDAALAAPQMVNSE